MTVNDMQGPSDAEVEAAVPPQAGGGHVRIGIFVLVGLFASIYLLYELTDPAFFRGRYKLTTTVENVMGLNKGDPVQMRGVTIGKVFGFEMATEGENVVITLEVEGQWPILEGSRAQLVSTGLMDPRTVEIVPGPGPGRLGGGASLPGSAVKGLLDDTESLGQMGQDVLNRVTELLSPKNLENITGSADGLNTLLAELSDLLQSEGENLKETISSLNRAADGLAEVAGPELREDLESTMESVASTMASADSAMGRLNATSVSVEAAVASLQTILTRIESGEGTLGRLWASDSLHTSLLTTAESVRLLLDDLRENPGRYFTVSVF